MIKTNEVATNAKLKECKCCGETKILKEFNKDARNLDGFEGVCKECRRLRRVERKCELERERFNNLPFGDQVNEFMNDCDFSKQEAEEVLLGSGAPKLLDEQAPIERTVFECSYCGKLYKTERGATNHGKKCFKNPDAWDQIDFINGVFVIERINKSGDRWIAHWSTEDGFLSFEKIKRAS
ncbi:hypothetical protein [Carboxylicivirga sp. RSCT41]|uniref:hypothetical protein n=1 Tax=Carboxylicivirga agarovorans TaxID=3417570 RepID=UPI003D32B394